jgi:hypothetical protein
MGYNATSLRRRYARFGLQQIQIVQSPVQSSRLCELYETIPTPLLLLESQQPHPTTRIDLIKVHRTSAPFLAPRSNLSSDPSSAPLSPRVPLHSDPRLRRLLLHLKICLLHFLRIQDPSSAPSSAPRTGPSSVPSSALPPPSALSLRPTSGRPPWRAPELDSSTSSGGSSRQHTPPTSLSIPSNESESEIEIESSSSLSESEIVEKEIVEQSEL